MGKLRCSHLVAPALLRLRLVCTPKAGQVRPSRPCWNSWVIGAALLALVQRVLRGV